MKKIIHIDADCFYAAIEIRENPSLQGLPIAVGGSPEKRGVVATCNYEARKFGVHSAMPSRRARELCPFLQIISPRMTLYREYSARMRDIFSDYTDNIEPLSLDEAYLDVSNCEKNFGSATLIAKDIRARIKHDLGITVSAGVAPVKFLAKVASDWNKPDGLCVVSPDDLEEFVLDLPVTKLSGVGPVTAKKLAKKGIHTCRDIQKYEFERLFQLVGSFAPRLFEMSQGIDKREVKSRSERKSISVERTFDKDFTNLEELLQNIEDLLQELEKRVKKSTQEKSLKKAFVKLKFNDFSRTTMESNLERGKTSSKELFQRLVSAAWQRKKLPVRLLGLGYRISSGYEQQLELPFD